MRLAKEGWAPHLTHNPVQRRLPRERLLAPGPQATATDALVQEYQEKRMVEEIAPPSFVHHGLPVASLDNAMVRMQGMPFKVPRTVYPWVHDFFLTPKPHQPGKWRGITNAKLYNEFAFKRKFKLHGVQQLRSTLRPGDYMCGFDVQDFFPHIGLVDHFKNHFIFRHRRQGESFTRWYRFVSLMFGVHDAPRSSVRIMLPVLAFLRSLDVRLAMFIDDGLAAAPTEARCIEMFQLVVNTLAHLGFLLHEKKCKPRPSQRRLFLGSVADSSHHHYVTLRLPASKVKGIKRSMLALRAALRTGQLTLRTVASALGKARAARDCLTVAYLMTRELLRWQNACIMVQLSRQGLAPRRMPFFDNETCFDLPDEAADLHSNKHASWFALVSWDSLVVKDLPASWLRARTNHL